LEFLYPYNDKENMVFDKGGEKSQANKKEKRKKR